MNTPPLTNTPGETLESAIEKEDPLALARVATQDELERLKAAEDYIEKRRVRRSRTRLAIASQSMIGYVALAGFFVNAYQSYASKQQQTQQRATDQERWNKEFDRAQQADKYRAFFETSVLATDAVNPDKRLVGYALLEEFVADKDYNSKATLMLEESLMQELVHRSATGNDAAHEHAVEAILTALGHTSDCHALERAASTVDRVAKNHVFGGEDEDDIFRLYVRKLFGHAVTVCSTFKDLKAVREPLTTTLVKIPDLGGLKGRPSSEKANEQLMVILNQECADEMTVSGTSECPSILSSYDKFCQGLTDRDRKEEAKPCELVAKARRDADAASSAVDANH